MDSIYDRLLAGESAEDIVKQFTDELNAASARYEDEVAAAKRAKADEEARYEDAYDLAAQMIAFFMNYGGVELNEDEIEAEVQNTADMLIQSLELARKAKDFANSVEAHPEAALEMLFKMMI